MQLFCVLERRNTIVEEKEGYIDVTKEWLENAKPNSHKVRDSYFYISNDKVYIVDGSKNVVLDYSLKELEVANFLENTFGGEIYMNPRVNIPNGVKTADYWWNGEYWDLKELKNSTSLTRAVDNVIKDCEKQSHNFIIDITDSEVPVSSIIKQVKKTFTPGMYYRLWVNKIIIKYNDDLIGVFTKK